MYLSEIAPFNYRGAFGTLHQLLVTGGIFLSSVFGIEQLLGINKLHCVLKNIPDIFDCNLKTTYQILIIFGRNILDTTCHQMTI